MSQIPPHIQATCDRDLLTEPFRDSATGKWFAFPNGGVMPIEVKYWNGTGVNVNVQISEGSSIDMTLLRRGIEAAVQNELTRMREYELEQRAILNQHLGINNSQNSSHSERMMSVVSHHFSGAISEGLLFYAKRDDIEGIIIDRSVSRIQLRSSAEKAMYWLNHKIGRWVFHFENPRNQVVIETALVNQCQESIRDRLASYPEIQNSKIMEIESFRAESIDELQLHYPGIRRIVDRVEIIIPQESSAHGPTGGLFQYQYAPVYRQGVFCFERVL